VSDVKVRLAVGGAAGGKADIATTDRSGAFTLHGLRSGSSYTIIAEYEDEEGTMSGRAQVKAPETNVRIALQPRGGADQGHASIRPARSKIEPISNIESSDEERAEEINGGSGRRINAEDLEPPADEAAAVFPDDSPRTRRASVDRGQSSTQSGWNIRQGGTKTGAATRSDARRADTSGRANTSDRSTLEPDDDGPNPLPPAIESGATSRLSRPGALVEENLIRTAQSEPERSSRSGRQADRAVLDKDDSRDRTSAQEQAQAPSPIPAEILAGATSITDTTVKSPQRPTWRELGDNQIEVPLDESLRTAKSDATKANSGVVTLTSANRPARTGLFRLLGGAQPKLDETVKQSACSIDPTERRLIDFKLPDLDGKMVSLRDIDADVILLDFWGSWCQPCRKSIPHLIELKSKFAAKRVQVIGIACEKATSVTDRRASAAKAVQELGINYPVLLSSRDGSCPLQEALQVQFYPTMVLLGRDGRLLAREHGATNVTLPRMDRAIAMALQSHESSKTN